MYSGLTVFTKHSGAIIGAHQKIDRLARKQLSTLVDDDERFPKIKEILHFEGLNGPDGIKRKSPGHNEPWHYIDPTNKNDTGLHEILSDHHSNLKASLRSRDLTRSAFEAAWLSHAIVDGLTPAHHYPYEHELSKLRGGEGLETRTNFRKKLIMPGSNSKEKLRNNWKMWGAGGLYTTHATFEMGVATLIAPLGFNEVKLDDNDVRAAQEQDIVHIFDAALQEVAKYEMYDNFYKKGWTPRLANQVRHKLGPILVRTVTMAWYGAYAGSELGR